MFNSIRTSLENKERVTELTNKLVLGTENVIARIALGYSLSKDTKLSLTEIQDSKGKEYSRRVLFGEYESLYVGMICQKYNLNHLNKEIPRYLKMHVDNGLEKIHNDLISNPNVSGIDYLLNKLQTSINFIG